MLEVAAVMALAELSAIGMPWFALAVAVACVLLRPATGGVLEILLGCLAFLPLAALLPPGSALPWEAALPHPSAGVTPQPFVLLAAWPSWLACLVFLWWICGRSEDGFLEIRQSGMLLAAVGGSLLLTLARWESGAWQGPLSGFFSAIFPTRNQAGGYAAVGFAACAMKVLFATNFRSRTLWALGTAACAAPLVLLGSRGAVGAAVAGSLFGWLFSTLRSGYLPGKWRRTVAGFFVLLLPVGLAAVFLPEAPILERFGHSGLSGTASRLAIQQDAWHLLGSFPLTGIGLENFDAVFPFFRQASASTWRAFHPESDWLWVACEAGLITGVLAWGIWALLASRLWTLSAKQPGTAAVGFAAMTTIVMHGLLDVPAHCTPVLVLAGALAGVGTSDNRRETGALAAWMVALGLLATTLLTLSWNQTPRPPVFRPDRPRIIPAQDAVQRWLELHPLDYEVVELEVHRAIQTDNDSQATLLLERLFLLEPFSTEPAMRAFEHFAAQGDARMALVPARKILERTPPVRQADKLEELLQKSPPEVDAALLTIPPATAAGQAARMIFVGTSLPRTESLLFVELAARPNDPGISTVRAIRALSVADDAGHEEALNRAEEVPALAIAVAAVRARRLAAGGDWESACRLAAISPGLTDAQILSSATTPDPVRLALRELREERPEHARALLRLAEARHATSPELWYVLACTEWKLGSPERAWNAFVKYFELNNSAPYANP